MTQNLTLKTISKIFSILEQDVKKETKNDSLLKDFIKIMFSKDSESNIIAFPKVEEEHQKLLVKFIELVYSIFQLTKDQRDNLWIIDTQKIKDKNISRLIYELDALQNIEVEFQNEKIDNLWNIIFPLIIKNKYSFIEFLFTVINTISYIPQMNMLLKYRIYLFLIDKYANVLGQKIDFKETEINIEDEVSIDIILNLLTTNKEDDILFIQLLVILKYDSLRNTIINQDMKNILKAFTKTNIKLKKEVNIPDVIYYEKIIMIFNEELEKVNNKKKRKKKNKKKNEEHIDINNGNYEENKTKNIKDEKLSIKFFKKNKQHVNEQVKDIKKGEIKFGTTNPTVKSPPINMISNQKELSQETKNESCDNKELTEEKIININIGDINKKDIKDILDKILKMDNNSRESYINELKDILYKIIDDNTEMKNKMKNMNASLNALAADKEKKEKELDSLKNELDLLKRELNNKNEVWAKDKISLNEKIDNLNLVNDEIKQILGSIQTRDIAKNFLRCFKRYLSPDDKKEIEKDYFAKGSIISNRIKNKFSKHTGKRKMDVILNLITNSFDSLNNGNNNAHSILLDIYEEDIQKNIKQLKK